MPLLCIGPSIGGVWSCLPSGRAGPFFPLTRVGLVLSAPDGVLSGVMPPAGDFSHGRKVTKSPLRTHGSKNSFRPIWGSLVPLLRWFSRLMDAKGSEFPCFRALARSSGGGRGWSLYRFPRLEGQGGFVRTTPVWVIFCFQRRADGLG